MKEWTVTRREKWIHLQTDHGGFQFAHTRSRYVFFKQIAAEHNAMAKVKELRKQGAKMNQAIIDLLDAHAEASD